MARKALNPGGNGFSLLGPPRIHWDWQKLLKSDAPSRSRHVLTRSRRPCMNLACAFQCRGGIMTKTLHNRFVPDVRSAMFAATLALLAAFAAPPTHVARCDDFAKAFAGQPGGTMG